MITVWLAIVFAILSGPGDAYAASAEARWTNPTTNEDGTPLTDLAGTRLQWGLSPGVWDRTLEVDAPQTSAVMTDLEEGTTIYVVAVAFDTSGNVSDPTETVSFMVPGNPPPLPDIPPIKNRLVHLSFDDQSVGVATNHGTGANGTLHGGTIYRIDSPNPGFSLEFNGADGHVDLGRVLFGTGGFTFTAWFRTPSLFDIRDKRIVSKAKDCARNECHVFMVSLWSDDGILSNLRVRVRVGGVVGIFIADGASIQRSLWQHVAVTHDNSTLRVYLDGNLINEWPLSGPIDDDPTMLMAVGNQPEGAGAKPWGGHLDDIRLYLAPFGRPRIRDIMADLAPLKALVIALE